MNQEQAADQSPATFIDVDDVDVERMHMRLHHDKTMFTLHLTVPINKKRTSAGLVFPVPTGARSIEAWTDGTMRVTSASVNVSLAENEEEEKKSVFVRTKDSIYKGKRFDPSTSTLYESDATRTFNRLDIQHVRTHPQTGAQVFMVTRNKDARQGRLVLQLAYPAASKELSYQVQAQVATNFSLENGFGRSQAAVYHVLNIFQWHVPMALTSTIQITVAPDPVRSGAGKRALAHESDPAHRTQMDGGPKLEDGAEHSSMEYEFRFDFLNHLASGQAHRIVGTSSVLTRLVYDHTLNANALVTVLDVGKKDLSGPLGMALRDQPGPVTFVSDTGKSITSKRTMRCAEACIFPLRASRMESLTRTVLSKSEVLRPVQRIAVTIPNTTNGPIQLEVWERHGSFIEIQRNSGIKIGAAAHKADAMTGFIRIPIIVQPGTKPAVLEYDHYFPF